MNINTQACDVCRVQKKESNHWYKAYLLDRDANNRLSGIMVLEWDINSITQPLHRVELLPENADAHLCGADCASRWISKILLAQNPTSS
jgi:hypothetical protein